MCALFLLWGWFTNSPTKSFVQGISCMCHHATTVMVSNVECVQFHGRVNLIHNNKIYLLKIICIFNIEIIRECCTYQNGIFESSFSFIILECIRLVCGSTVCEVVFAFLEFWLRIGCTYWNGIVESSSISYYAVYTVSLWYLPFWNFDYTLYWWVESVDGHYFTLQTLDDSIV